MTASQLSGGGQSLPDDPSTVAAGDPHRFLVANEVAALLRVSPKTLRNWRSQGRGPKGFRIGGRVVWRATEVDAYLAAQEAS